MKNLLIIILVMSTICSCKKEKPKPQPPPADGTMVFYKAMTNQNWSLILDGVEYGTIVYSATVPACGAANHLTLSRPQGKYEIKFKSYSGLPMSDPDTVFFESGKCKSYKKTL